MYLYVYDELIIKNEGVLHKIEKRLTDLGLNGQIVRPGVARNTKTAIEDKIKQGAKTIVAVGSDETISDVINIVSGSQGDHKTSLTVGVIPLEKESLFAYKFGIGGVDDACRILLARRLKNLSLARINDNFFLFKAEVRNTQTSILEINKNYSIQSLNPSQISITSKPAEKFLEVKISNKEGDSILPAKSILIVNKDNPIISDGSFKTPSPALLVPGNGFLKIIVGKNRKI